MELISYESAAKLHSGARQPYSQYVVIEDEKLLWNIQTLTLDAYEQIIIPLLDEDIQSVYLRHKDIELPIMI